MDYRLSPLNNRVLRSVFSDPTSEESASGGKQPENPETPVTPPEFTCSVAGLQCKDCETVVNCLDMGGKFLEITTSNCGEGETCNNGTCSKEANHQCSGLSKIKFACHGAVGMFPDPADCQKYYVCAPGIDLAYEAKCDSDRAYDMTRTYCSLKMGAGKKCPLSTTVPTCTKPGYTFVLANKSIFGMCVIEKIDNKAYLVPRLYLCPNGGTYTPATFSCA